MLMLTGVILASCRAQSSAFIASTDNISVLSTAQKMTPNCGHNRLSGFYPRRRQAEGGSHDYLLK
jgi:hypothetical protein